MASGRTERLADVVGLVTLGFGIALTVAPRRSAAVLGLGNRPVVATAVGLTDLVVGPGLLWGRHRWRWMTARAALNLLLAAGYGVEANRSGNRRAQVGAIAMGSLTISDAALAVALAARPVEKGAEPHPATGPRITD